MKIIMLTIMLILVAFPYTPITTTVFGSDVTLSGQVVDHDGKPLDVIRIKVEASDRVVLDHVLDLKPGGLINVSLGEVKENLVRCYISADGFEKAGITALVQGGSCRKNFFQVQYIEVGTNC